MRSTSGSRSYQASAAAVGAELDGPPVRVFYQLWAQPLMTINRHHVIDDVIRRCGGVNLFADAPTPVPHVGVEAVVVAAPELIIAASALPGGAADRLARSAGAGFRRCPP